MKNTPNFAKASLGTQKGFSTLLGLLLFMVLTGSGLYLYSEKISKEMPEVNSVSTTTQEEKTIEPEDYLKEKSRINEIEYYPDKPVGYTNPYYSNIVGYDYTVGITMSIPAGVTPSLIKDGDIGEVVAYRLEDSLSGKYNDTIVIFSCFEPGFKNLKNISYINFSEKMESKNVNINNRNYYLQQFESFYVLYDTEYMGPSKSGKDIFGCGLVMVGKELSEVNTSFIGGINYTENREKYLQKIFNEFNKRY